MNKRFIVKKIEPVSLKLLGSSKEYGLDMELTDVSIGIDAVSVNDVRVNV